MVSMGNAGAIMFFNGSLTLENCEFSNNYSGSDGGAVYSANAELSVINCTFRNNQSG